MSRPIWYVGDPVPSFKARTKHVDQFAFDTLAGRYVVLSFFGTAGADICSTALNYIVSDLRPQFNDEKVMFFGVSIDPEDEAQQRLKTLIPGIRYFLDFDRIVSTLYGAMPADQMQDGQVSYFPFTLVLDPFLRVIANIPLNNPALHNETLKRKLSELPSVDEYAGVPLHAPVLVLPRVFEREICQTLIHLYNQHGGGESGYMQQIDGKTVPVLDYTHKRRKDFYFESQPEYNELRSIICTHIQRRLIPEVKKVFQFDITRIERYLVACYQNESEGGGYFRPHRDNTTSGTAHRRFACTINLNSDDFEGGELRFPEFGTRTYRAPSGGAVIFSCSLLHEATPVTKGTRYAFLPFFYDEEARKIRTENRQYVSREMIDKRTPQSEESILSYETEN